MNTLKSIFEKPTFIWLLISILFLVFFFAKTRYWEEQSSEKELLEIIEHFEDSTFPPKIDLIRRLPDWQGHVGYYALSGRLYALVKGDLWKMRLAGLLCILIAMFFFVQIGYQYIQVNRANPLWLSTALFVLVANPYLWKLSFFLSPISLFLLLMMVSFYFFQKNRLGWSGLVLSLATLVDWTALLLAIAFVITRVFEHQSRFLRPERVISMLLPFVIGALPFFAWHGLVPEGQARNVWNNFWQSRPIFRLDLLFYVITLLPIYCVYFTWVWGLRARTREQAIGIICAAILIPVYFIFSLQSAADSGMVYDLAVRAAGQYKSLLLVIPWFVGMVLLVQLVLIDVRDRSRPLRYFILLFFAIQPFVIGAGDELFLSVIPFILLFSLSEALVSDVGKLS